MMEKIDKVLVAITNDVYEHIVGMWDSTKQCSNELKLDYNILCTKISRKSVYRKLNARFEWMVVESE